MIRKTLKQISSLLIIVFCFSCLPVGTESASACTIWSSVNTVKLETANTETVNTEAAAESGFTAADIEHVQDLADILTDEEEASLQEECISVGENNEIDILILTTDSVPVNRKVYLEDFYDANDTVLTDAVLILVNMEPDNRGVEIQGYGQCEFSISDDRIEQILDEIVPYLSDGDYYGAFSSYINEVDHYMSIEATSDYVHTEQDNLNYNENYYEDAHPDKGELLRKKTLFNLLIAVIAGAVSVSVMLIHSKGEITVNSNTYLDPKNSRLLGHWDRYIRTTTTRVRKPQNNNSSGGFSGGGGVSSGGHSHSGGGRSF